MRRALTAALAVAALVGGAACGSAARTDAAVATTAPPSTTTSRPTTSTTTATTAPVDDAPLLSQPIAPPAEDYYDEPLVTIGHLSIPRLDLDTDVYQGLSLSTINNGPSHWPGTALPGHLGNVTLAGHRVTHSRPFQHLEQLQTGDVATFTTDEGTFTYEFAGREIVTPDRVDIATQWAAYTATMFACHPPGSARERIVAYWRLTNAPAPGQPDPASFPAVQWPPPTPVEA
jgi:sortase A